MRGKPEEGHEEWEEGETLVNRRQRRRGEWQVFPSAPLHFLLQMLKMLSQRTHAQFQHLTPTDCADLFKLNVLYA